MSRGLHTEEEKEKIRLSRQKTNLRHASMDVKVYELKIVEKRLNKSQKETLDKIFLEGKRFYNFILSEKKRRELRLGDLNPIDYKQIEILDKDKKAFKYQLEVLPSHFKQTIHARMISNEKTIRALVKKGLQKSGSLKFKSELNCIPLKTGDWKFKSLRKVWIMGVKGQVLVKGTDQIPLDSEFANANLIKRADGYFLKVTAYQEKQKQETNGKEIGLDFGIKTTLTTSEGEKIDVSVGESDRLKKLQREMLRRVKGSNNRWKTIKNIRRAYQKMSNRKQDKANKIMHKLKAYDRIYMQDEQIASWHKGLFGKQVQHSCLGLVKVKLKALPQTVVLDKWIPTTQLCPKCYKKNPSPLDQRTYSCSCGYQENRDAHAAKNMIQIAKSCFENGLVPPEQREVTLMEFKASVIELTLNGKLSGRRSEKITSFKM